MLFVAAWSRTAPRTSNRGHLEEDERMEHLGEAAPSELLDGSSCSLDCNLEESKELMQPLGLAWHPAAVINPLLHSGMMFC
jgi:hypothetical protein